MKQNPILDDLAGLMTGALGAAKAAGEEVQTAFQSQVARFIADMDLASREEIDVLKALLEQALERIDTLETQLAEMRGDMPDAGTEGDPDAAAGDAEAR